MFSPILRVDNAQQLLPPRHRRHPAEVAEVDDIVVEDDEDEDRDEAGDRKLAIVLAKMSIDDDADNEEDDDDYEARTENCLKNIF